MFVVNANILFSFFSKQSDVRNIILFSYVSFKSPAFATTELLKHKDLIIRKFGLNEYSFEILFNLLKKVIDFIPLEEFQELIPKAVAVCPHLKDIEYFVLALKLDCPIWSNEKKLKRQSKVKIFSTKELIEYLS